MMRFSSTLGLLLAAESVSGFSAGGTASTRVPSLLTLNAESETPAAMDLDLDDMFEMFDEADKTVPGTPVGESMSEALPFLSRPKGLDSMKLAGDRGFDPLGLAKGKEELIKYRNAEIKHARLAMLAAAGWPISEKFDAGLASLFNLPVDTVGDGMAPSLLNGGLGAISPVYWALVLAGAAAVEFAGLKLESDVPGDFGFDPLGLYPKDQKERAQYQESEIRHGRIAMVAIVAFAAQEFIGKEAVVKETPFFFEPIWKFVLGTGAGEMHFGDLTQGFASIPTV
mmetsp:Transcript_81621/g.159343  ORF Transcript_81621/g.159343 Transcript_81621/m.159343 type:complete len:283 (-) Transcript_81621:129-977(-)